MSSESVSVRRTGPMKAVGVINLILGSFTAFGGAAAGVFSLVAAGLLKSVLASRPVAGVGADGQQQVSDAQLQWLLALMPGIALGWLIVGCLLMVSGRGLLGMKPWGRTLSLWAAWVSIIWSVFLIPANIAVGSGTSSLSLGYMLYWVLVICLLSSREWKAAYAPVSRLANEFGLPASASRV